MLAYLRLVVSPDDSTSFHRAVSVPSRGIGPGTWQRIDGVARRDGVDLTEACRRAIAEKLLSPRAVKPLEAFLLLMEKYRTQSEVVGVPDLILGLLTDSGYVDELVAEGTAEAQARVENLRELVSAAQDFQERSEEKSLTAFLDSVALISDVDEFTEEKGSLTLMTLHMAKGLEFPLVVIVGMEEGIFPHARALTDGAELEEERRLCYVGMTRAKKALYLITALQRRLYGTESFNLPSRFLDEIPPDLLERHEAAPAFSYTAYLPREPRVAPPAGDGVDEEPWVDYLQPGMRVRHAEWGVGTIRERIGSGEDLTVVVTFAGVGRKKLAVRLAPLDRV